MKAPAGGCKAIQFKGETQDSSDRNFDATLKARANTWNKLPVASSLQAIGCRNQKLSWLLAVICPCLLVWSVPDHNPADVRDLANSSKHLGLRTASFSQPSTWCCFRLVARDQRVIKERVLLITSSDLSANKNTIICWCSAFPKSP